MKKTLALLRIEDEQTADHERSVEHHLQELRTRLDALAGDLEATQDSAVV